MSIQHYTKEQILSADSHYRRHLINSISGFKSANLVGTLSPDGVANLSMISSVVHIGATPPLQGWIMRPLSVERQTYNYIKERGTYTINHVHASFLEKAHQASAKYEASESEFDHCKLDEEYLDHFEAPYVGNSKLKMGLKYVESHEIKANGTIMIIGEVQHLYIAREAIKEDGNIDLSIIDDVVISGLECYYKPTPLAHYSFARPGQWPKNII